MADRTPWMGCNHLLAAGACLLWVAIKPWLFALFVWDAVGKWLSQYFHGLHSFFGCQFAQLLWIAFVFWLPFAPLLWAAMMPWLAVALLLGVAARLWQSSHGLNGLPGVYGLSAVFPWVAPARWLGRSHLMGCR